MWHVTVNYVTICPRPTVLLLVLSTWVLIAIGSSMGHGTINTVALTVCILDTQGKFFISFISYRIYNMHSWRTENFTSKTFFHQQKDTHIHRGPLAHSIWGEDPTSKVLS